jgi:signal transduction histidine kinase
MRKTLLLPRLRTLLIIANLTTLLLPLGGIILLHLYESELVRQTESALIGQGALLAATFRQEILRNGKSNQEFLMGFPETMHSQFNKEASLTPIRPQLDVAKENIFPTAPDALNTDLLPPEHTLNAGMTLEPILRDAQRITLAGIRLVDHNGIVVASSGSEKGKSLMNRREVKEALQGRYISLLRERISDEPPPTLTSISRRAWMRVFVALPVVEEERVLGAVVLSRSPIGVGRGLYMIRNHLFKATAILLILAITVSLATTFAITRPIKALIRQADKVGQGEEDASETLKNPGTKEVEKLSLSIAQMATSLSTRADYIRTFARNVSHEFKTPLTSLKGAVELLQDHGSTMEDKKRQHFLKNMDEDIENLNRMVARLLELAKADVIQPGSARCDINQVLEWLRKRYADKDVSFSTEKEMGMANAEPEILQSILTNLVDNALQHGAADTSVQVIGRKLPDLKTEWLVVNSGETISKANTERIFRPFFTTARHKGGTGLGLSIVQALLTAHNGHIELLSEAEETTFRVIL